LAEIYFFDLDRTLVKVNITRKFLLSYFVDHPLKFLRKISANLPLLIRYQLTSKSLEVGHLLILGLIEEEYDEIVEFSKKFSLKMFEKELFLPVYEELREAFHTGKRIIILSAAPEFIVVSIAQALGISEAHGTTYCRANENQLYLKQILTGAEKAKIAKQIQAQFSLKKEEIAVYSDSIQDLELLCLAGQPVVVNPDKQLIKIAKEENWRTIE
jgi:HAD superfamily phosphoserine phosphatase-like hydrolase